MQRSLLVSTVLAAVLAPGCMDRIDVGLPPRPERYRIAPVRGDAGLVGRSVIDCPTGRCLVLHFPPVELPEQALTEIDEFVERVLTGDARTAEDDGHLYCRQRSDWCAEVDSKVVESTFNCCTFAVGDVLGLTTGDWIATTARNETEGTFPMQIILSSYFDTIRQYQTGDVRFDWRSIETDSELQQDDVVCFLQTHQMNGETTRVVHAGRIWKTEGRNWLVSKAGFGPILVSPFDSLAREYAGDFDIVQVHRLKVQDR